VQPLPIVEHLDVLKDGRLGLGAGAELGLMLNLNSDGLVSALSGA
jgi:hypothetical protein